MESLQCFWRWTVVALIAFGVMLASAGILGTWKLLPEKAPVTGDKPRWSLTDGGQGTSREAAGSGEPRGRAEAPNAELDDAGDVKPSDGNALVADKDRADGQTVRTQEPAERVPARHERPDAGQSQATVSGGPQQVQAHSKTQPDGDAGHEAHSGAPYRPEGAAGALRADSDPPKPSWVGGAKNAETLASDKLPRKEGVRAHDSQADVGWDDDSAPVGAVRPVPTHDEDEEEWD